LRKGGHGAKPPENGQSNIPSDTPCAPAVGQFRKRPKLGLSDCLVLEVAGKAGHLPLGTFDRNLGKLEGVERL
jgi:predicted nucleic acid-binding protein